MRRPTEMDLPDDQTFFIDPCSLPQPPRTEDEESEFLPKLFELNECYGLQTIVLVETAANYETRAWCMYELIYSVLAGKLLNEESLEGSLRDAFELAQQFIQLKYLTNESQREHGIAFGKTMSGQQMSNWLHGALGVDRVQYEMMHRTRDYVGNWLWSEG
jgi:hypothetical protein